MSDTALQKHVLNYQKTSLEPNRTSIPTKSQLSHNWRRFFDKSFPSQVRSCNFLSHTPTADGYNPE